MRPGVRVGVDVGTVRIGIAACDPGGVLATPVETIRRGKGDIDRILAISAERAAIEVVVGLPRTLSGTEGASAASVRSFARLLAVRIAPLEVRMVDERLTTAAALRGMRASGVSEKRGRSSIDQAAAVIILQDALDAERHGGFPPGQTLKVQS